jgi:mRNA-degrading endonuclease RelE of RelBE toxin-antitoxin system
MTYQIVLSKSATKFLKVCDKHILKSFQAKSKILAENPFTAHKILDITPYE